MVKICSIFKVCQRIINKSIELDEIYIKKWETIKSYAQVINFLIKIQGHEHEQK